MKRFLQIAAFALVITLGSSWRNKAAAQPNGDISYQTFYDELSPYGQWIDYPEYGYVWVPTESPDFRPYSSGGHWVWSDEYDWMWVSDYSWGWAPFHYGRWFDDPFYGWMWMPGYEWAPAWVAWRDGGDYYGWAPLQPGFDFGVNLSFGSYNPPVDYWCFTERRYICSPRIYDYCLDRGRNGFIINNTIIINNFNRRNNVFVTGPRRDEAERYAGRINPVRFRDASEPGRARFRNNEVSVYRPRVNQNNSRQFEPRNFERYDRDRRRDNGNAIGRRDNNNPRNGNDQPVRGNGNDNSRFDRGNNNGGRFDRRDGSSDRTRSEQPVNNDRRISVPGNNNSTPAQPQPGNDNRRFDRRNDQPAQNERRGFDPRANNPSQQQPTPDNRGLDRGGFGRRNDQPANDRRNFEPRNNGAQQQPQPQNNNRGFDRGGFDRNRNSNPAPRMERPQPSQPQAQPRQQPQAQPRQSENRGGGNDNRGNRGGGEGRGRRG